MIRCFLFSGFLPAIFIAGSAMASPVEKTPEEILEKIPNITNEHGAHERDYDAGDDAKKATPLKPAERETGPEEGSTGSTETRLKDILQQAADGGFVSLTDVDEAPKVEQTHKDDRKKRTLRGLNDHENGVAPVKCADTDLFLFSIEENAYSYEKIFQIRNELMAPHSGYDETKAVALGITYVALGLGEEAVAIGDLLRSERTALIVDMGKVVSRAPLLEGNSLKAALQCTDKASLWLAMAELERAPQDVLNRSDILVPELKKLPGYLKQVFAVRYGIAAAEHSQIKLAERLANIAAHAGDPEDASLMYLQSLLATEKHTPESLQELQKISMQQGPMQIKALLKIGQISADAGMLPYKDYIQDLYLARSHYADSDAENEALLLEIQFQVNKGSYARAIEKASIEFSELPDYLHRSRDIIARSIEQHFNSNKSILRFSALDAYAYNIKFFTGYENIEALKLAAAQTALYFDLPVLVLTILKNSAASESIDLVLARAEMALHNHSEVLTLTQKHPKNMRFHALAAEAAMAQGNVTLAISHLDQLQQTKEVVEKKALYAWNNGDWHAAKKNYGALQKTNDVKIDTSNIGHYKLASYMDGGRKNLPVLKVKSISKATDIRKLIQGFDGERELLMEVLNDG